MTSPLTTWRQHHDLSQRAAARAIGCSRAAWQLWESGQHVAPRYIHLAMRAVDMRPAILSEQPS